MLCDRCGKETMTSLSIEQCAEQAIGKVRVEIHKAKCPFCKEENRIEKPEGYWLNNTRQCVHFWSFRVSVSGEVIFKFLPFIEIEEAKEVKND